VFFWEHLPLKLRQKSPDPPPALIGRYQVLANILHHYSLDRHARPPMSDDDFRRNINHKLARPSLISRTGMKGLLKQRLRFSFIVSKFNLSHSPNFHRVNIEGERKHAIPTSREIVLNWARRRLYAILFLTVLAVWGVLRR